MPCRPDTGCQRRFAPTGRDRRMSGRHHWIQWTASVGLSGRDDRNTQKMGMKQFQFDHILLDLCLYVRFLES